MRRTFRTLALVLAAVSASACGGDGDAAPDDAKGDRGPVLLPLVAASLAELTGPWRAQPLALDPVMAGRIADRCARDMEGPPGVPPQIIDVRGGGVAMARLSGPTSTISCSALQITAPGTVEGAGGGWRSDQAEVLPEVGLIEISVTERSTVDGGALKVRGWSVLGRAGAGVASVTVEPVGHPVIVATLQNGWFAAWWPVGPAEAGDAGRDAPAVRVRGFGPLGDQIAEELLERGS